MLGLSGAGADHRRPPTRRRRRVRRKLTAGPRISTPVSRQGGMPRFASPSQRLLTHSPETKATAPSTVIVFPVIAAEPPERAVDPRRVEESDVRASGGQVAPKSMRRSSQRPQPIADEPHLNAGTRSIGECGGQLTPDLVVLDDVVLEGDAFSSGPDGVEPGRIVRQSIL